jgi:hypothetical protein
MGEGKWNGYYYSKEELKKAEVAPGQKPGPMAAQVREAGI